MATRNAKAPATGIPTLRTDSMADKGTEEPPLICAFCGKEAKAICTACKSVRYCNRECQKAHRKDHKKECKRIENSLKPKKVDNSIDAQVRRRYKELRKEGVPIKDAMAKAREEFGQDKDVDATKSVANMFGMA